MLETSSTDDYRWSAEAGGAGPQNFFRHAGWGAAACGEAPSGCRTGSGNLVVPREVAECRLRGPVRWLDSTPERPRVRVAVAVPDEYAVLEAVMNLGRIVRGLAAAASAVVLSLSLSACSSGGPSAPASQGGSGQRGGGRGRVVSSRSSSTGTWYCRIGTRN